MTTFEAALTAGPGRYAIVCSRFNDLIVDRLLHGALDALTRHVPGAWEIPIVAQRLARSERYVAVVCLGAVIRGATAHFEHIAGQCSAGLQRVALETGVPVGMGVLTTETIEQAIERAGTKAGNKGADAAVAAIEMANLLRDLPQ